jgi:hypothetical protein
MIATPNVLKIIHMAYAIVLGLLYTGMEASGQDVSGGFVAFVGSINGIFIAVEGYNAIQGQRTNRKLKEAGIK